MTSFTNQTFTFGEWIGTMHLEQYLLSGIIWSVLVLHAVPAWIFFYAYLSAFIVLIYDKTIGRKREESHGCFLTLAYLWDTFGRIWHGYELHGIENLPVGPGLIIYYHGALPLDYIFFIARLYLIQRRICCSVVHRATFKIPGFRRLLEKLFMNCSKKDCFSSLKSYLLGVSPGGTQEAIFSDSNYPIIWAKQTGFAQLAIDTKVPIVPMFTENNREGYKVTGQSGLHKMFFEKIKLPFAMVYGGFPVKWRTYLGEPIPYDPNITAEELAKKVRIALEALRDKHQKRPGSIGRALLERFQCHTKEE